MVAATAGWWRPLLAWAPAAMVGAASATVMLLSEEIVGQALVGLWLVVTAAVGGVVASRLPRHPIGWLLLGVAAGKTLHGVAEEFARHQTALGHSGWQVQAAGWVAQWLSIVSFGLLAFVLLLFPDGRLPSPRWRPVAATAAAVIGFVTVAVAVQPGPLTATGTPNPLSVATLPWLTREGSAVQVVVGAVGMVTALTILYSLYVRYRRANDVQRQQLRWLRFAALTMAGGLLFTAVSPSVTNDLSFVAAIIGLLALPVSIGVAVLRYRLWDLELVVNRALVWLSLTVVVVAVYAATVVSIGTVFDRALGLAASLTATAIVAIAFDPLRRRVQHLVDRLMYGERRDPYTVLSGLTNRLHAAVDPIGVPELIVQTLTGPVGLEYAAVEFDHHGQLETVAAAGHAGESTAAVDLTYQDQHLGRLVYRPPARPSRRWTERLLADVARQAGPALHALRLATALQRSRERLVVAREDERRRLRADLHDLLGPQLAGLTLGLEAAGNILDRDPSEASQLLVRLQERTREAVGTVRGVIDGLRPAALDQLGLVDAIRERADAVSVGGPATSVRAEPLPVLPAAVEVAAYQIAVEAVTNAVRHANARHVVVTLKADAAVLHVEIRDDGSGLASGAPRSGGVGMESMRERAAELGGAVVVTSGSDGTTVTATLPLRGLS